MSSWNTGAAWPSHFYPNAPPPQGHVYMPPPQPFIRAGPGYWEQAYPQTVAPASSLRSSKYPHLNPILAADTTQLKFDIRRRPRVDIMSSIYHSNRYTPVTLSQSTHIVLVSKSFPWSIVAKSANGQPLTCENIWEAIHFGLQQPLEDSEWGFVTANKKQRESTEKAHKKRIDEGDVDKKLKRIDVLGEVTLFKGLERDEDFEKMRKLHGETSLQGPEIWVVKLGA